MSQDTIELDEFVTLYSGYLSKQLNESMQDAWKEELWKEQKDEYIKQYRKEQQGKKWLDDLLSEHGIIELLVLIPSIVLFVGLGIYFMTSIESDPDASFWESMKTSCVTLSYELFFIIIIAVAFIFFTEKILGPKARAFRRRIREKQRGTNLTKDAQKDFFAQEVPKIKGEFVLQFCLHQADDVVDAYTKELRTKKKEAFDFIKRQEEYSKEVQSTFSSDSEKGKSLLQVIEERIFHTQFRMKNIDEMIAQSEEFKVTLEQQAKKVVQKIKEREAEQKLVAKIQQDNGEGLDLNLTDDEEMLDSFQTLETFLSESSCFVDMVKEMDNDSPIL